MVINHICKRQMYKDFKNSQSQTTIQMCLYSRNVHCTCIIGAHRLSHKLCLYTLDVRICIWRPAQGPSVESAPCSHKPPHCGRTGGPLATPPDHILMTTTNMMMVALGGRLSNKNTGF